MPNIISVIKYEGDNQTFIWKHPKEDFTLGSQLIVHESQEAIFFMNGQALDLFGAGRYTLSSQNLPLVRGMVKLVTSDDTPFHCEVYYINKTEQIGIKWGTDTHVNYLDPNFNNYPFPVGASGTMNLRVTDSRKLLVKVVGTQTAFSQEEVAAILRGPMMAKIKSYLPTVLAERKIPIFDIDRYMEEFSNDLRLRLLDECEDYGLELVKFWINAFAKPENDPLYRSIKDLRARNITEVQGALLDQQVAIINQQTKTQKAIMEAQARAEGRRLQGYTYQEERAFDVAELTAQNESVAGIANIGTGLGMIGGMAMGVGGAVAGITGEALRPISNVPDLTQAQPIPAQQPAPPPLSATAFPENDAAGTTQQGPVQTAPSQPIEGIKERMEKLNSIKDLIPEEVYQAKLKEILDSV